MCVTYYFKNKRNENRVSHAFDPDLPGDFLVIAPECKKKGFENRHLTNHKTLINAK